MVKIYFSVEEGFEKTASSLYMSSRRILSNLNSNSDLFLVHPKSYSLKDGTIKSAYKFINSQKIEKVLDEHEPTGDMFVIYGDETSKNIGLDFARDQYVFLKNLKYNGNFKHFFNEPETEEATLKDALINLSNNHSLGIAETRKFSESNLESMLEWYGSVVMKPIFGCRMSGVRLIKSKYDIKDLQNDNYIQNYILQEPLSGPEKRIVLLNNKFLSSRIHFNRGNPWTDSSKQYSKKYFPSKKELELSRLNSDAIGSYLIGVDFIGNKINEINGTGTGVVISDHNDVMIYDKSSQVANAILDMAKK